MRRKQILILSLLIMALMVLASCKYDNNTDDLVFVTMKMQTVTKNITAQDPSANPQLSPLVNTSLIFIIPANTDTTADVNLDSFYFDAQLLDLATNTVTLTVPIDYPMQMYKMDYLETFTSVEDLFMANPTMSDLGYSEPFTVSADTGALTVTVTMLGLDDYILP